MLSDPSLRNPSRSSTVIPSTPAEPLLALTWRYAFRMFFRLITFSIILYYFQLPAPPIIGLADSQSVNLPMAFGTNLTFSPSSPCETSVALTARSQ